MHTLHINPNIQHGSNSLLAMLVEPKPFSSLAGELLGAIKYIYSLISELVWIFR